MSPQLELGVLKNTGVYKWDQKATVRIGNCRANSNRELFHLTTSVSHFPPRIVLADFLLTEIKLTN